MLCVDHVVLCCEPLHLTLERLLFEEGVLVVLAGDHLLHHALLCAFLVFVSSSRRIEYIFERRHTTS